ncbi:hypothetical protein SCUP234_11711 [Seiridium cupressi]
MWTRFVYGEMDAILAPKSSEACSAVYSAVPEGSIYAKVAQNQTPLVAVTQSRVGAQYTVSRLTAITVHASAGASSSLPANGHAAGSTITGTGCPGAPAYHSAAKVAAVPVDGSGADW